MEWQVIVALIVIIPVILFPVAFIWYLNIGGVYALIRKRWKAKKAVKVTPRS